ncbi:MAG: hypothetical protein AAGH76_06450 [Pseudomonadota bacterium]
MPKTPLALALAVLVGAGSTYALMASAPTGQHNKPSVRDIAVASRISMTEAEDLRSENYAGVTSIEAVMGLPSSFARREALYVLSGRADVDSVQALIFDAGRIDNDAERGVALTVLIERLTDLDPESALALVRSGAVDDGKRLEQVAWSAWSHHDFDAALAFASDQPLERRRFAAQSLYLSTGPIGSEQAEVIETTLGIEPDRLVRTLHLFRLADQSIHSAIAYADAIPPGYQRLQTVAWLAHYLVELDPDNALSYAERFTNLAIKRQYISSTKRRLAYIDPAAKMAEFVRLGGRLSSRSYYQSMQELAATDRDAALAIFDSIADRFVKYEMGTVIAQALAEQDPDEALRWAREVSQSVTNGEFLIVNALQGIAAYDPPRALAEALALPTPQLQNQGVEMIVSSLSYREPETAAALLDTIDDTDMRRSAEGRLLQGWVQRDPVAVDAWLQTLGSERINGLVGDAQAMYAIGRNIDLGQSIIARLTPDNRNSLAPLLANSIAMRESPEAAISFIDRWSSDANRDDLMVQVVRGTAETDIGRAEELALQLPTEQSRNQALASVATQLSRRDPWGALSMLERFSSSDSKSQAMSVAISTLSQTEPQEAIRYLEALPRNDQFDRVVSMVAANWRTPGERELKLVRSIRDADVRKNTYGQVLINIARRDRPAAERALNAAKLTDEERDALKKTLDSAVVRGY